MLAVSAASCAALGTFPSLQNGGGAGGISFDPPRVTFSGAVLAQSPSQKQFAAYYCPQLVSAPLGSAGILCQGFFGRRPTPPEMNVAFDLRFHISNPNRIPIPLTSVLSAVTVFPASSNQQLGATCVQLCADGGKPGEAGCGGPVSPAACQASARDVSVRSLSDFVGTAANLLVANGIAAAAGQPFSFAAPPVSAAAELDVIVRFSFGPEPLLATLRQLATQSVDELAAGRTISLRIPFRVEGTVWFDAGSFGRVAVGYGPMEGMWVLPVEGLTAGLLPG